MDAPKPKSICPECGCKEAFYHCALQIDGEVYDWGTVITCLGCGTPYSLNDKKLEKKLKKDLTNSR